MLCVVAVCAACVCFLLCCAGYVCCACVVLCIVAVCAVSVCVCCVMLRRLCVLCGVLLYVVKTGGRRQGRTDGKKDRGRRATVKVKTPHSDVGNKQINK